MYMYIIMIKSEIFAYSYLGSGVTGICAVVQMTVKLIQYFANFFAHFLLRAQQHTLEVDWQSIPKHKRSLTQNLATSRNVPICYMEAQSECAVAKHSANSKALKYLLCRLVEPSTCTRTCHKYVP